MKREDNREERAFALLQALGDLNEEDVLRAEPGRGIRKRRNWGSVAAAAAFILVCGSVVGALYISWPMDGGQSGSTSGAPPVSSSGVTSGETGGAGSASGSDGAEGSAAEETFTVYLLDEAALDAGETDFDALAGTAGTLAVSGDEAELDGEPVSHCRKGCRSQTGSSTRRGGRCSSFGKAAGLPSIRCSRTTGRMWSPAGGTAGKRSWRF